MNKIEWKHELRIEKVQIESIYFCGGIKNWCYQFIVCIINFGAASL